MPTSGHRPPKLLPPVYFLLAIILMAGLHFGLPLMGWVVWPWNLIGIVFIVFGLTMTITAAVQFRRSGTAIKPFESSSVLVTNGVFRVSRNPMYLGLVIILAGSAIALGSFTPFLVVPVFAWWIALKFVAKEEAMLTAKFGEDYLHYKEKVRRWL